MSKCVNAKYKKTLKQKVVTPFPKFPHTFKKRFLETLQRAFGIHFIGKRCVEGFLGAKVTNKKVQHCNNMYIGIK